MCVFVCLHTPELTGLVSCCAGESSAWRFYKFHVISHLVYIICVCGWIENSSCQAGEHCHKFYLKLIKRLTNNHVDWEKQIFNIHNREQGLQTIISAVSK